MSTAEWLSVIGALLGILISVGLTVYMSLQKYATTTRDGEINRRLSLVEQGLTNHEQRLHTDELATVKLGGDVALVKQAHDTFDDTIAKIEAAMVPRTEWESRMAGLERQLQQILAELRARGSGRYAQSGESGLGTPVVKK
jgi:hypothetical protein